MFEITITEIKSTSSVAASAATATFQPDRIKRLEMTVDGDLDIPTVIKAITIPKRKRNAKKASA